MAPSYILAFAGLLAIIFPSIPVEQLNITLNTVVSIFSLLGIMYRQVKTGRSTVAGTRPDDY